MYLGVCMYCLQPWLQATHWGGKPPTQEQATMQNTFGSASVAMWWCGLCSWLQVLCIMCNIIVHMCTSWGHLCGLNVHVDRFAIEVDVACCNFVPKCS